MISSKDESHILIECGEQWARFGFWPDEITVCCFGDVSLTPDEVIELSKWLVDAAKRMKEEEVE